MAETRYITIPPTITVKVDGQPDTSFPFDAFVHSRTGDAVFGKDLDGVLTAVAIRQHMSQGGPGSVRALSLEQWEKLCESVRHPSAPYNPSVMIQLMPFARAILDAPSTDPRPVAAAEDKRA